MYRFDCAAGDLASNSANGAHFFLLTILKTYILGKLFAEKERYPDYFYRYT